MQIAAQTDRAPANARECGGHCGTKFVPVSKGDGRWVYYWLSLPQLWFWRTRSDDGRAELVRNGESGCFLCNLQEALEDDTLFEDGPVRHLP